MRTKQKKPLKKTWIFIPASVLLVVVGSITYSFFLNRTSTNKVASTASFNFNASKVPGWWAGDNINPDASMQTQDHTSKEPTASRVIAQGTYAKPTGDCFVMYSYWANDSKDPAQVLGEITTPSVPSAQGSFTLKQTNTESLGMKVSSFDTPFQLHQYNKIVTGGTEISSGEEYAVIKAGTGYIKIMGVCKTTDELSTTLPVFSAVSFKE